MKKLILLTFISFALVSMGNAISRRLPVFAQPVENSGWAMFKELFQ